MTFDPEKYEQMAQPLRDMVERLQKERDEARAERDAAIARAEEENAQAACGHQMRFAHYETKNECYLCDLDDAERERDELGAKLAAVKAIVDAMGGEGS